MSGLFITVEGLEGVGKSTNLEFVKNWLVNKGLNVETTREPGGTNLAEDIRELLLTKREENVSETCELLMMFAARAQHIAQKINPWLEQGKCVLSDRFTDATYAYQGGGRQMDTSIINQLEDIVQNGLQPDFTLLLDAPAHIGLKRIQSRGFTDRIEQEKVEFFDRAREGYLARAKADPKRMFVIDASQPLEDVQTQIEATLTAFFKTREKT
ncbi:MAG: dTMP kinase [Saccharospirillaceae bacterium]|nr:dTMP kinase [Pseudomonadales bacterium]NRB80684.1 dTMP kinase [Saccharospirillaceae bacterium]